MININRKLIVAGGALYIGMSTATYLYLKARDNPDGLQHVQEKRLPHTVNGKQAEEKRQRGGQNDRDVRACTSRKEVFDKIADMYDSSIDTDELLMGLKLLRRWLLRKAQGDVLEVSVGTGRNLPYYDKIRSLTMIDSSKEMILQAWDKHLEDFERKRKKKSNFLPTFFALADVERLTDLSSTPPVKNQDSDRTNSRESERHISNKNETFSNKTAELTPQKMIQPPSDSDIIEFAKDSNLGKRPDLKAMKFVAAGTYDTVVDTFGLCSCDDPVLALKVQFTYIFEYV